MKPLDPRGLPMAAAESVSRQQGPPAEPVGDDTPATLVGRAHAMLEVYHLIARLASNGVPALITGEPGTGKQLVAETIHANSARRSGPFAAVDCATLTESAIAEIFSGDGGTLLLANVEAMPAPLQSRVVRAIGGGEAAAVRITARVLAATERDLSECVRQGTFSRELFEILSLITIRLPPLRERRDDIPELLSHLIRRFTVELNRPIAGIEPAVVAALQEYQWPGNVRELESVVKRACILARGDRITVDDVGGSGAPDPIPTRHDWDAALRLAASAALHERLLGRKDAAAPSLFHDAVTLVERTLITEALRLTNGNQVKAAEILGVNRATLRKKMA